MKRKYLLLALAIISLLATYAISQTVTGQNWVGYVKVNLPPSGQFTMVGVNFEAVGAEGGGIPLNEVINTNSLIGDTFFTRADNVFIYNTSRPGYDRFYYNNGAFYDAVTFTQTNPIVHSGDAFWLQSSSTATEPRDVYILGQVNLSASVNIDLVESFQMIGNPYPTDLDLNDGFDWIAAGATGDNFFTRADNVFIFDGTSYDRYYLDPDGNWRDAVTFQIATDAIIPAGRGAWYDSKGGFTKMFDRPFSID
jgi:hypothetical protein